MAKRPHHQKSTITSAGNEQPLSQDAFQVRLQGLLKQQKYRQALEEIKAVHRTQPELDVTPSEAEIWSLRGQQEFQKQDFKQSQFCSDWRWCSRQKPGNLP